MTTWVYDDGGRFAAGFRPRHVGDCVTRAIAIGTGKPYAEVVDLVNTLGRERGRRMFKTKPADLTHYDVNHLLGKLGWTYHKLPGGVHFGTDEFVPDVPTLIVRLSGHLCAVVDGVIRDTWDCSLPHSRGRHEGKRRLVRGVYLPPGADEDTK